jgi:hypothetical protein
LILHLGQLLGRAGNEANLAAGHTRARKEVGVWVLAEPAIAPGGGVVEGAAEGGSGGWAGEVDKVVGGAGGWVRVA